MTLEVFCSFILIYFSKYFSIFFYYYFFSTLNTPYSSRLFPFSQKQPFLIFWMMHFSEGRQNRTFPHDSSSGKEKPIWEIPPFPPSLGLLLAESGWWTDTIFLTRIHDWSLNSIFTCHTTVLLSSQKSELLHLHISRRWLGTTCDSLLCCVLKYKTWVWSIHSSLPLKSVSYHKINVPLSIQCSAIHPCRTSIHWLK